MAPWTGDLQGGRFEWRQRCWSVPRDDGSNAVHGVARKVAWTRRDDGTFDTQLDRGWPLGGHVTMHPVLGATTFDLELSVVAGESGMPAALGWHPWFPRQLRPGGADAVVELPPGSRMAERDKHGRPTGRFGLLGPPPWNETLQCPGPVEVVWPGEGSLEIRFASGLATVFSGHPQGLCVEPVSSPAERMEDSLGPSQRLCLQIGLRWKEGRGQQG